MTPPAALDALALTTEESRTLAEIRKALRDRPYLRFDLGASNAHERELEDALSTRLALLHLEGPAGQGAERTLADKLRRHEARLAEQLHRSEPPNETRLRFETAKLLHPEPASGDGREHTRLARAEALAAWEAWHGSQPHGKRVHARLRQYRDFARHGAMLPFYWLRRHRIRARVPRSILEHRAMRETFFAIEQVGPLVDNFAFEGRAGIPTGTRVALADLAFLYMQLADELLDELAVAAGGFQAAGAIVRDAYEPELDGRPLRDFSLREVRAGGVDPDAHLTKFSISLGALFEVLRELETAIDDELHRSSEPVRQATHRFLHHCFQTYLDEVDLCERAPGGRVDRQPLRDVAWHFYRKNNLVMMLWLDLRARTLGLDPRAHADAIRRWGYLLASFQVFDDLKDLALDLDRQPSYALQTAAGEFPSELAWLERRFRGRRRPITRDEVAEVSLSACRTVRACMEWSRLMALAHFDNTLAYAWDQRWRRSWTTRRRSFNAETDRRRKAPPPTVDRLIEALRAVQGRSTHSPAEADLAYALDAAAYEGAWRVYLALFPNLRAIYRFATLRMWMSAAEKAAAARRLLRRSRAIRSARLVELAEGEVDHQVAGDGLEALPKLLEV